MENGRNTGQKLLTEKPMILLYRDGLGVVRSLFGNPIFAKHMMMDPKQVVNKDGEQEYSEWMTGDYAWAIQDQLPISSTIVGVVGASDKTTVTRGTGGIDMHPTFFTLTNISLDMTGREHREIQRTIVAMSAGAVTPSFLRADMVTSLSEFHQNKQAILDAEARRGTSTTINHFNIPKLELLQHFARAIRSMGAVMQFMADVTEHLLITHCKHPFSGTNGRRHFELQCVRILDRLEKARMFHLYSILRDRKISLINHLVVEESSMLAELDPESSWLSRALPEENHISSIRPLHNHFLKGIQSIDARSVLHLTKQPGIKSISINDAAELFALEDLPAAIADYAQGLSDAQHLHSTFWSHIIMPPQTIQAYLPLPDMPLGNCDAVMLGNQDGHGLQSTSVVQTRIIFQAIAPRNTVLDQCLSTVLIYAQNFGYTGARRDGQGNILVEEDVDMYMVERLFRNLTTRERIRAGNVYPLNSIHLPVNLIPVFGAVMNRDINSSNSMEVPTTFYVNNFSDKETYNMFLTEFAD
ncbi:hypothetical protein SERLADRAFT_443376 [Serpula lacrymans var. lacrymans S7.9]|uniref:DUF6830 domain-containing protein n=1 Tax=Serpula lacrymans var. lacrymans (strain S7.9) TaxID=578457 RepID=F8PCC6_SERL9|nr:uncharacterized protein SERLADRAFT_443376 [Serpula lacrymans var. lacrymans S7.9]EGO19324.1 hypothetical protein SERLADRAFT_443376 [Serpula lacrymans var. lacrymans S7.9]